MPPFLASLTGAAFTFRAPPTMPRQADPDPNLDLQADSEATDLVEPLPDFAARGITDPVLIRENLRRGPSVRIIVGPQEEIFTLPKRLLLYHSTAAQKLFATSTARTTGPAHAGSESNTIRLATHHAEAFAKLQSWFVEGTFHATKLTSLLTSITVGSASGGGGLQAGIQHTCTLLCRIYFLADTLGVSAVAGEIVDGLDAAMEFARNMRHPTPFVPATVMEVHECCGPGSLLWEIVVGSVRESSTQTPLLDMGVYGKYFEEVVELEEILEQGSLDRILAGWRREAERAAEAGEEIVVDEGRPAGWWKGPF